MYGDRVDLAFTEKKTIPISFKFLWRINYAMFKDPQLL